MPIPTAPFFGSRVVDDIQLDDVFAFINETALFKGQWQFKQGRMPLEQYQALVREKVRPVYEEIKERSKREKLLVPKVGLRLLRMPIRRKRFDRLRPG